MKTSGFIWIDRVKQQSVLLLASSSGHEGNARRRVWLETARDVQGDEARKLSRILSTEVESSRQKEEARNPGRFASWWRWLNSTRDHEENCEAIRSEKPIFSKVIEF